MRKAILVLALLSAPGLFAHNVFPQNNAINLSPEGPLLEDLIVQHFPGEACVVSASASVAQSSPPLVVLQNSGPSTALDVYFFVSVLRAPNGTSETAFLTGSWKATGINTSGQPESDCDGSGLITMTITVYKDKPPQPPTVSSILNPGLAIEPVSTATGELSGYDEQADLDLGGPLDLSFRRYYASLLSISGGNSALGPNWVHNFDVNLAVLGNLATVSLFRGKTVSFALNNGVWQLSSTEQRPYQLAAAGTGYQFLDPVSNLIYTFNSTGALTAIADRNGNTLTVTQAAGGVGPAQVSDGIGRTLTFTYRGTSLASVKDQSGRSVSFTYDGITLSGWTNADGKQTTFSYTYAGSLPNLMTAETRPAGNQPVTQTFDASGRVVTQSDSFFNMMTLSYATSSGGATLTETAGVSVTQANDANLNLTSMSDPSGGVSKYAYDSNSRPISTTDRLGNQSTATWDAASGLPASYTDELGNTTSWTYASSTIGPFTFYDLAGIRFPDGTTIAMTRDSKGNVTSLTDQAGDTWQATWTANGWLATLTNPSGGVFTFGYNSDGTQASLQTPSSDTTKFAYDSAGRLSLVTNPDSTTKSLQYDPMSNLLKATDERNNSIGASFDANNNPKTTTDALAAATTFAWDTDDRLTSTTDPLGKAVLSAWDSQSRLKSVTNAAGNSFAWTYDKLNRVTAVADASGNGFTYGLDGEGRATSITDALSRAVSYTHDAHGNVVGMATPKKENFGFSFDALNRLVSAADPLGRTAQYTWDARGIVSAAVFPGGVGATFGLNELGLATAITDPVGNVWTRAYDNMGRLVSASDPLGRKTSYQYDSRQRVASATLPLGTSQSTTAQYSYDAAGNLTGLRYSDGTSLSYTWDANGRLTAASGLSLSYDSDGRIVASNGLQTTRDAAGRIASVIYSPNKTVTYTYNNRGLLSQVADWVGNSTSFTYDAAGELTNMTFPNGVSQTWTWDADGDVASLSVGRSGTTLASATLTRDALGRVTSAVRSSANIPAEASGYLPLAYDAASQVLGETWDGLGRVTTDALRTYNWDLASRLTSYSGSDGAASSTWDALGQRLSRTSGGATQNYAWNYAFPLPCLSVVQSGGTDQTYYVWLPDGTLLSSISAAGNSRRFYHFDESGSVLLLTDSSGAVTDSYAISAYGDTVTQAGSTANPFTFQGKFGVMREGSTSLYYMRARYYDSAPARFLSRDPLSSTDPRAINPYQFVYGNPVEGGDATGMGDGPAGGPGSAITLSAQPQGVGYGGLYGSNVPPVAAFGTRVLLRFNNVPPGVPMTNIGQFASTSTSPIYTSPLSATISASGSAVWEVPGGPSQWKGIPLYSRFGDSAGTGQGLARSAQTAVETTFGPLSGTISASSSAVIPRFVDKPPISICVDINLCRANVLFPYITNQPGFDTGIAITNTTTDPFGTAPQAGSCTLNWYTGLAPCPNPGPTPNIPSVVPGFQGYTIAVHNFQNAH